MPVVCMCTISLAEINKSVCHLRALSDWHYGVHLGPQAQALSFNSFTSGKS